MRVFRGRALVANLHNVVAHRAEFGILSADASALHRDGKRHLL